MEAPKTQRKTGFLVVISHFEVAFDKVDSLDSFVSLLNKTLFPTLKALEVMCGELQMTGVLVATKDKQGRARAVCAL